MQASYLWKKPVVAAAGLLVAVGVAVLATEALRSFQDIPETGEEIMSSPHIPSSLLHADETTFEAMVLQAKRPVLVDFYADWCGPCQRLTPVLEQLAAENPKATIVKVNVDHNPELAARYGVEAIPSLKLFKNGAVAGEMVGLASRSELERLLQR